MWKTMEVDCMDTGIIWKRLIYHGKDLGDFYMVSNTGEIKGVKSGRIRKKNINHEGYYFVGISLGSRHDKPCVKIHRAVAETFIVNTENHPVINHIDGNKLNNNVLNLEFCTHAHNTQHAIDNGLLKFRPIICLNNYMVFDTFVDANKWCGLSRETRSISRYVDGHTDYSYAGRHPITGEKLYWTYYDEYLKNKYIAS